MRLPVANWPEGHRACLVRGGFLAGPEIDAEKPEAEPTRISYQYDPGQDSVRARQHPSKGTHDDAQEAFAETRLGG